MKIGIFDPLFAQQPIEEMLDFVAEAGCTAVEIGTGRYPGTPHIDVDGLLEDDGKVRDYKALFTSRGLEISALSCHGNPLHPNKEQAQRSDTIYRKSVALAQKLELQTVVCFSGCPGDSEGSKYPNWVTCPWPPDFLEILDWQWNTVAIPYWREAGEVCRGAQHPRCLRDAPRLHLLQPGDDAQDERRRWPGRLARMWTRRISSGKGLTRARRFAALKDIVYYVHAKDTAINPYNVATNGVLGHEALLRYSEPRLDLPLGRLWPRSALLAAVRLDAARDWFRWRPVHRA